MGQNVQDIFSLFSTGVLQRYLTRDTLDFADYSVFVAQLIRCGIPFDTKFTPGNARNDAEFTVTVYMTPKVNLTVSFSNLALTDSP